MAEPRDLAGSKNIRPATSPKAAPAPQASGPFSRRTVELVQQSWAKVMPISDAAATLFYDRLFQLDPTVRPLFKADIREQKKKLMQTLAVAVDGLSNPAKLIPVLQKLGETHAGYMVVPRHYDLVGEALLWTLGEGLGDGFTPEVATAWTEVYGVIADVMKKAAAALGTQPAPAAAKPGGLGGLSQLGMPAGNKPVVRSIGPVAAARRGIVVPGGVGPTTVDLPPDSMPIAGRTLVGITGLDGEPSAGGLPSQHVVDLVQKSWAVVMPISDVASMLFYDRLFELDPTLKPLFKSDMREQRKKLMQTLAVAVDGLSNPAKLIPVLQRLGETHAGYMVQDRHYDTVGEALLWTLREGMGEAFTPDVAAAWIQVYTLIADVMKTAAHAAGARAATEGAIEAGYEPSPLTSRGAQPVPVDDEANTLHFDRSSDLPKVAIAPARPRAAAPAAEPALAYQSYTLVDPAAAPRGAPAPAPAGEAPRGVYLPLGGGQQELTVKVNVKMDAPWATPEQAAPVPTGPGLAVGLVLALLCMLASMGLSAAFALGSVHPGEGVNPALLLGVPVGVLVLAFGAFALGYVWGKGRAPAAVKR